MENEENISASITKRQHGRKENMYNRKIEEHNEYREPTEKITFRT